VSDKDKQIALLIEQLPVDAAKRLYSELDETGQDAAAQKALRRALVAKLNAARADHARRLFTQLFEPFLLAEPAWVGEEWGAPGVIHVLDVGGVWAALAAKPLGALPAMAATRLAELAQDTPIYLVLRTPEVVALREEVRRTAADRISAAMADPQKAKSFLEAVNRWRRREAEAKQLPDVPRPLKAEDVAAIQAVLAHGPAYAPLLERCLAAEGDAEAMAGVAADLARLAPRGVTPVLAAICGPMVPLTLLRRRRAYRDMAPFLVEVPPAWQPTLLAELDRHLRRCCKALAEEAAAMAGAGELARRPLVVPSARRELLERELLCMDEMLDLFDAFDLMRDARYGARAREHLDGMIKRVETTLYPYLEGRVVLAAQAEGRGAVDHAALAWALGFCTRWRNALTRRLHWGTRFSEFRDALVAEIQAAFRGAFAKGAEVPARERMAHAVRGQELAQALGVDASDWLTLLDPGLVRTAAERLDDPVPLTGAELAILGTVVGLVREEIRRTKHWKDAGLVVLLNAADRRGVGERAR